MNDRVAASLPALFLAVLLLVWTGCDVSLPGGDNPGDDMPQLQTQILRVDIVPDDVVAVGDTARFTAVITDSTDERFELIWSFSAGSPNTTTEDSTVLWKAADEAGKHEHGVQEGGNGPTLSRNFEIVVTRE